jgi:GAF domain-containing protein
MSETPKLPQESVEELLALGREAFGMDVALFSEFTGGRQVYRWIGGDAESFGLKEGGSIPLEASYCQRVLDGRTPNFIPDAKKDERVRDLRATSEADIGSYIGVEVKTSDGRSYGTLCLLSHEPATWLGEYDVTLLERFTRDVTRLLERKGLM